MLIPLRNKKNFSEFVIVGQFKHNQNQELRILNGPLSMSFEKNKLK